MYAFQRVDLGLLPCMRKDFTDAFESNQRKLKAGLGAEPLLFITPSKLYC